MAYTAEVTKQLVTKRGDGDYEVSIHVVVKDDLLVVLLEKDYSKRYSPGDPVDSIKQNLQRQIMSDWDQHVAESAIFDAVAFSTMVGEIEIVAGTYINA